MLQPQSESERIAEEIEGQKLRALFQADINQRASQKTGHKKEAITLLLEAYPILRKAQHSFINKASIYAARSDMKTRYSARQITAYAAAEILMRELDMRPQDFHGVFVACCHAAQTHIPEKKEAK